MCGKNSHTHTHLLQDFYVLTWSLLMEKEWKREKRKEKERKKDKKREKERKKREKREKKERKKREKSLLGKRIKIVCFS